MSFNRKYLMDLWLTVYVTTNTFCCSYKIILPLNSVFNNDVGFSSIVAIKIKSQNKFQLSISLCFKLTNINVNINIVIMINRKQAHPSHKINKQKL